LLEPDNKIRRAIAEIINHKVFDYFILILIFCSCIVLALQRPLSDPKSQYNLNLDICDNVLTACFILEFVLKVVAFGFLFNGKNSYLRNAWNGMDFIIVLVSIISLMQTESLMFVKSIRLFRIIRPLKMITKNEGLKIAVLCLINSIKDIFRVFVVCGFFFLLFAIFGVNLLKGKMYYCYQKHLIYPFAESPEHKWKCLNAGGEWVQQQWHFDHVFYSLYSLF